MKTTPEQRKEKIKQQIDFLNGTLRGYQSELETLDIPDQVLGGMSLKDYVANSIQVIEGLIVEKAKLIGLESAASDA